MIYQHVNTGQKGISTINRTGWTHGGANTEILLHTLEVLLPSRAVGNIDCRLSEPQINPVEAKKKCNKWANSHVTENFNKNNYFK